MTEYRVMIKGESWQGRMSFDQDPAVGTSFAMPSGTTLIVESVHNDPIDDDTPAKLIITSRA